MQDNVRLEQELEKLRNFQQQYEAYREIQEVLHKHRIYGWRYGKGIADELDRALSMSCPEDVSSIRQSAEIIVKRLRAIEEAAVVGDTASENKKC